MPARLNPITRICHHCGTQYTSKATVQMYCDTTCKENARGRYLTGRTRHEGKRYTTNAFYYDDEPEEL